MINPDAHYVLERFNGGLNNDAKLTGSWIIFAQYNHLLMH
jgi:hypothetical protein